MDVTICVGTFGDQRWIEMAQRAIASAEVLAPTVHVHDETLAKARNACLSRVSTEWVIFLDADDELPADYLEAMAVGNADLRSPAVCWIKDGKRIAPFCPQVYKHRHACTAECLREGNFIVIGALVRTAIVKAVGGFREFEWSEDWDLWVRCWQAGASIESIPAAVYIAHFDPQSRNHAPSPEFRDRVHWEIHRANFGEAR